MNLIGGMLLLEDSSREKRKVRRLGVGKGPSMGPLSDISNMMKEGEGVVRGRGRSTRAMYVRTAMDPMLCRKEDEKVHGYMSEPSKVAIPNSDNYGEGQVLLRRLGSSLVMIWMVVRQI